MRSRITGKCLPAILLCAAAVSAADFTTGQAARLVIGQETFTSQNTNSSDTILGAASGLAYAADTLFVADSNRVGASPTNHRVLLYQNLSSQLPSLTTELSYDRKCPVCVGRASVVLGQPDFTTTTQNNSATSSSLRLPTALASDGVRLVVADTDHNRVLIWNRIPSTNNTPADVVVGQADFATSAALPYNSPPTATSLRGPQGVWIQNGKLYVADTQNNRVLIWNNIPTTNNKAADVVLGQPNFTTYVEPDLTQANAVATASNLLNPVSVSSDGVRLYVADLGHNRVLIWSSIPNSNNAAADVVIGQPDMTSSVANNAFTGTPAADTTSTDYETPVLCTEQLGTDANGKPTYPTYCNATLNFPRFALAAGNRLFIADGGNDRVLIYNQIPTANATSADMILGQIGGTVNQASDAADSLRTPMSMAWDGINLYVSDAFNRRITVYSMAENVIPYGGIVNAASLAVYAGGSIAVSGTVQAGDAIKVTINGTDYTYTILTDDTINTIIDGIVKVVNTTTAETGDPYVSALADYALSAVLFSSKLSGTAGNDITLAVTVTPASGKSSAAIVVTADGSTLSGGSDAAKIAPGSLVTVQATEDGVLAYGTDKAPDTDAAPTQLAGTEVYFNGIRAPVFYVSPTQINAQVPWEIGDTTSISAYVRSTRPDGVTMVTTPVAMSIVTANPGVFAQQTSGPDAPPNPPATAIHASSYGTAVVSIDGTIAAGDVATITIGDNSYSYTAQATDTTTSVSDALIALINGDPKVTATAAGVFARIMIQARIAGPEGNGIPIAVSTSVGASVVVSAFDSATCCANVAGSLVSSANPARPGEYILVYATGLGVPVLNDINRSLIVTGIKYPIGGPVTEPVSSVSSLLGGKTADVLSATLMPGTIGTYQVLLHLNSGLVTDAITQFWIAQDQYRSNIVTIPVVAFGQ